MNAENAVDVDLQGDIQLYKDEIQTEYNHLKLYCHYNHIQVYSRMK